MLGVEKLSGTQRLEVSKARKRREAYKASGASSVLAWRSGSLGFDRSTQADACGGTHM